VLFVDYSGKSPEISELFPRSDQLRVARTLGEGGEKERRTEGLIAGQGK